MRNGGHGEAFHRNTMCSDTIYESGNLERLPSTLEPLLDRLSLL